MEEYGIPGCRYYWKSPEKHSCHIHLFAQGNPEIRRYLAFRDYLIAHPETAQAYSYIKRNLAKQFPTDIEAYVNGKESFTRAVDYRSNAARSDQLKANDSVVLIPYQENWKKLATAEIETIQQIVGLPYVAIKHLGSTSIQGLSAKPIIDIFIALKTINEAIKWNQPLQALGYIDWPDNPDKTHHRYFKGMPPYGMQRTHHVHIMAAGDDFDRRVAFRDLLREHPDLRQQYETLKLQLATQYPDDREVYTDAKAAFVKETLETQLSIRRKSQLDKE
ncbi:MAG: hypothetical protein DHS20C10_06210 [marine bacterium B5-7]|nr:MAG: hypothetical protein DHS20C10_06210 [marine bacterium B5-7]